MNTTQPVINVRVKEAQSLWRILQVHDPRVLQLRANFYKVALAELPAWVKTRVEYQLRLASDRALGPDGKLLNLKPVTVSTDFIEYVKTEWPTWLALLTAE